MIGSLSHLQENIKYSLHPLGGAQDRDFPSASGEGTLGVWFVEPWLVGGFNSFERYSKKKRYALGKLGSPLSFTTWSHHQVKSLPPLPVVCPRNVVYVWRTLAGRNCNKSPQDFLVAPVVWSWWREAIDHVKNQLKKKHLHSFWISNKNRTRKKSIVSVSVLRHFGYLWATNKKLKH